MMDLHRNAEDAARCLLETGGASAVKSAAREAVDGGGDGGDSDNGSYCEAVDAFWRLRTREGIPAVRDVLWRLSVGTDGI